MGFVIGETATHALESITGSYTIASVSAALKAVSRLQHRLLCQGFTYGNYSEHIPNNMDYTVTPDNGKFVQAQGCTLISNVDPQIAAYRAIAGTAPVVSLSNPQSPYPISLLIQSVSVSKSVRGIEQVDAELV